MKVIFLEDVPKVARAGDIKDVSDGYGRNFLIPQKLALLAKPETMKTVKVQLVARTRRQAETEVELLELGKLLEGQEIVLQARTGARHRLYGSITSANIAAEVERITGFTIDKRKIELGEPIRQVGNYEVAIRLGKDIVPKIRVTVSEKVE